MRRFQVSVNGNSYQVEVEELSVGQVFSSPVMNTPAIMQTAQPVQAVVSTVASPPAPAPTPVAVPSSPTGAIGTHKINAPMQGKIVGIKVAVGDVVKQNDVLIILEAMKMENEIVSPVSGTIASINVALGHTAQTAELLISIN